MKTPSQSSHNPAVGAEHRGFSVRRSGPVFAVLSLAAAALACASPLAAPTVVPLDTAVALTLQAMAAAATPVPSETPVAAPTAVPDVLPHNLYFLNRDAAGLWQVFRLGVDGRTLQQITFEPINVDVYDVSPADGSIAYITNNQLYLVDAAGAGRRLLVDGGPVDDNNRWTNSIAAPVWSPDGRTLAFSHGGLTLMDPGAATVNTVLPNQVDTTPGFPLVSELYAPLQYSPDGTRLAVNVTFNEGGTYGIYSPSGNALVRLQRPDGGSLCCHLSWLPDSTGVYITSSTFGMVESGLYYADAAAGEVRTLLPGAAPDTTYNFAFAAQVGADNKLYYFFNNLPEIPEGGQPPLYLVRSRPDGVTDRTKLLPDSFTNLVEVLWAPDASLAIVVVASDPQATSAGEARVVYPDGRPAVSLASSVRGLRWAP